MSERSEVEGPYRLLASPDMVEDLGRKYGRLRVILPLFGASSLLMVGVVVDSLSKTEVIPSPINLFVGLLGGACFIRSIGDLNSRLITGQWLFEDRPTPTNQPLATKQS